MPYFRFIIEGSDFEMPSLGGEADGLVTGFFTTRRTKAADQGAAHQKVLRLLAEEWKNYSPTLTILDTWRTRTFEFPSVPNKGHAFFSDDFGRFAAASLEAEASRAPKSAAIWELASRYVEGDD